MVSKLDHLSVAHLEVCPTYVTWVSQSARHVFQLVYHHYTRSQSPPREIPHPLKFPDTLARDVAYGHSELVQCSYSVTADPILLKPVAEIGVALTSFGGIFIMLGVLLFFDGALLALGNVRLT